MANEYQFTDQQLVSFDNGVISGSGRIVGCADTGHAVIGRTYMVAPNFCNVKLPNETYPFSVIAISECHISTSV